MEFRRLGASGFTVPALSFGAGTFGGEGQFFKAWGGSDAAEASRLVAYRHPVHVERASGDSVPDRIR